MSLLRLGKKQMWCNCVSACGWCCTSFVFLKRWLYFSFVCSFNVSTVDRYRVTHNVSRLGAGGVGEAFLIFCNKSKTNSLIFKQQKAPAGAKALLCEGFYRMFLALWWILKMKIFF